MPVSHSSNAAFSREIWEKQHEEYLQRIEQYKDSPYYEQMLNNPYYQFQPFTGTWLQNLWMTLSGDESAYRNFYADRATAGDEYLSNILNAMHQEDYTDPSSQLARRKAAGLNDALNGGESIGSGDPGSVAPDETPPGAAAAAAEVAPPVISVASVGMDLFQSGISLFSFLQDFAGKSTANAAADIDLTDKAYDSLLGYLAKSSSMPTSKADYDSLSEDEKLGLDQKLIEQLEAAYKQGDFTGMYDNRKVRKLIKKLRGVAEYDKNGKPTLGYTQYRNALLSKAYGDLKTSAGVIGTPGFSEDVLSFGQAIADTYGAIDLAIQKAQKRIAEANASSAESGAQSAGALADYNTGYYTHDLGVADREAQSAEDQAVKTQQENQKIIEDMRKSINTEFDKLRAIADQKGGLEGMLLKLLIPYARARTEEIINQGFSSQRTGPSRSERNAQMANTITGAAVKAAL